jgi:ABC-type amino acid transport substrate-binding protein
MRQKLTPGLAALGLVAGLAPARADLPEVKARGVLRIVYVTQNTAFPGESPFFAVKSGTATGFDAEVLDRFCKRHSLRMEAVAVPNHQAAFAALLTGKGDVLAGNITATESRRKLAEFTVEVLPTRYVVVSRKPHRVVRSVDDLRTEKVGTTKGTSRHEATLEAGVPVANIDDSLPIDGVGDALRSGRITAAVLEAYAAASFVRADAAIQLGVYLGPPQTLAYALRREDGALLKALNEHISAARASPLWVQLLNRHFGSIATDMLKQTRQ